MVSDRSYRTGVMVTPVRSQDNGGIHSDVLNNEFLPFLRTFLPISCIDVLEEGVAYDISSPIHIDMLDINAIYNACYERFPRMDIFITDPATRQKKLFLSDMDSTMIGQECIDEIAYELHIGEAVSAVTERAMRGDLDFSESLEQRVALLKGADISLVDTIYRDRIRTVPGADILLSTLKQYDVRTVLVSGGFTVFAEKVANDLGFHHVHANILETDGRLLTGRVTKPYICAQAKKDLLQTYINNMGIAVEQTIAIGDGANDLPMLQAAGSGVAYHAKPKVDAAADFRIRYHHIDILLYMLGIAKHKHMTASAH